MKKTVLCWLIIIVLTTTFVIPGYANTDVSSSTQSNDSTEITDVNTEKTEQNPPPAPIKVDQICESSLNVSKETLEKIGIDANGDSLGEVVFDLSAPSEYDIHAEEFFLKSKDNSVMIVCVVSLGVLVCVGVVLVTVGILKKRKKNKTT